MSRHGTSITALLFVSALVLFGRPAPVAGQSAEQYSHFWFLANLARCGGDPCAVVSPVFRMTAVEPDSGVILEFRRRAEARFHGVSLEQTAEPVGERWRDEAEARLQERLEHWQRMGWRVYRIDVPDQPVPVGMLPVLAEAELHAFMEGFHAEQRGELGVAELWYRRLAELADGSTVADNALTRVRNRIRARADSPEQP